MIGPTAGFFDRVRVRYIVAAWLLSAFYVPGLQFFLDRFAEDAPWYWWELGAAYYGYAFLILAGFASIALARAAPIRACFGRLPTRRELTGGLRLTVFLVFASVASAYALFYPLSFIAPDFVQWWYIDVPRLIYFDGDRYPLLANLSAFLLVCIVAPVVEEVLFRALILGRWTRRWGLQRALFLSSALFAVMHADPIGAFLFALGMSVLYLETQSLFLPIFCHMLNNVWAWTAEAAFVVADGPDYAHSLQDFRDGWGWGVASLIITAVWTFAYFKRPKSNVRWTLPVT